MAQSQWQRAGTLWYVSDGFIRDDLPAGYRQPCGPHGESSRPLECSSQLFLLGRPFAVRAESDAPICAQTFGRAFTRGLKHTRGSYSLMGVPMKLE
jgi:hypothetical protein